MRFTTGHLKILNKGLKPDFCGWKDQCKISLTYLSDKFPLKNANKLITFYNCSIYIFQSNTDISRLKNDKLLTKCTSLHSSVVRKNLGPYPQSILEELIYDLIHYHPKGQTDLRSVLLLWYALWIWALVSTWATRAQHTWIQLSTHIAHV